MTSITVGACTVILSSPSWYRRTFISIQRDRTSNGDAKGLQTTNFQNRRNTSFSGDIPWFWCSPPTKLGEVTYSTVSPSLSIMSCARTSPYITVVYYSTVWWESPSHEQTLSVTGLPSVDSTLFQFSHVLTESHRGLIHDDTRRIEAIFLEVFQVLT